MNPTIAMNPMDAINAVNAEGLNELFSGVVALSWRAGWLIVMLTALRFVVRGRIPAQVWFAVWIVVALRLVLPFGVPVAWSPFNAMMAETPVVGAERVAARAASEKWSGTVAEPSVTAKGSAVTVEPSGLGVAAPWSWREAAMALWLAGVVGLGGLRLVASWNFRRELRKARRVTDERWGSLVAEEARVAGLGKSVVCLETEAVEAPALCGWLRPHLLFPRGFAAKLNDDELRLVARHELGHWRRRDLVTQALMQAAVVLHWFNPLVWVAARLARTDCELACDEFVLRREAGGGASAYGATLLKVLGVVGERRRPLAVVGILENRRQLAERIRMIADFQRAGLGRMIGGVVLVTVVAVVSATRESRAEQPGVTTKLQAVAAVQATEGESAEAAAVERARVGEVRARIENSRKASNALLSTVEAQRKKVEQLADSLHAWKERNNLGSLEHEKRLVDDLLRAINLEAARAETVLRAAEIRSDQTREFQARGALRELGFVAHQPSVHQAVSVWEGKRQEAAVLRSRLGEAHPDAIKAHEVVVAAETAVRRAEEMVAKQVDADVQSARRNYEQTQDDLRKMKTRSLDFDRKALQYAKLERDLKQSEQILRSITARAREISYGGEPPGQIEAGKAKETKETDVRPVLAGAVVSIAGEVVKPGRYALPEGQNLPLPELIAAAGGFTPQANGQRVRLSRVLPGGASEVYTVDALSLLNGDRPNTHNFPLKSGDLVFVPEKSP